MASELGAQAGGSIRLGNSCPYARLTPIHPTQDVGRLGLHRGEAGIGAGPVVRLHQEVDIPHLGTQGRDGKRSTRVDVQRSQTR